MKNGPIPQYRKPQCPPQTKMDRNETVYKGERENMKKKMKVNYHFFSDLVIFVAKRFLDPMTWKVGEKLFRIFFLNGKNSLS